MDEMREITKDQYRAIFDAAHGLFSLIHARMEDVKRDEAYHTREWSELHDLAKLANVISQAALRYSQDAPDAHEPVPYWPAFDMAVSVAIDPGAPLLAEGLYAEHAHYRNMPCGPGCKP